MVAHVEARRAGDSGLRRPGDTQVDLRERVRKASASAEGAGVSVYLELFELTATVLGLAWGPVGILWAWEYWQAKREGD